MTTFTNKELIKEIKERAALRFETILSAMLINCSGIAGKGAGGMAAFEQWLRIIPAITD